MATRIRRYEHKLNPETQYVEDWFTQFELDLQIQCLIMPDELPETAEQNERDQRNLERVKMNKLRTAHVLTSITPDMFVLTKSLMSPDNIDGKTYEELKKAIIKHLAPKPTVLSQRFSFF